MERTVAFRDGLARLGYTVFDGCTTMPGDKDIMLSWNRIREAGPAAVAFESAGRPVLITENASWGNSFASDSWLTLARSYHNMAGRFTIGSPGRWDALGVTLDPWRTKGETVVLPQRGIGPAQVRMPAGWTGQQVGRVRMHPGQRVTISLKADLAKAAKVKTWGSGAAIQALMWGCKVESDMPNWIGQQDNTDDGRLAMFRRLAWAQWRLSEIRSGEALEWALQ